MDLLFGEVSPSGRLPLTFPKRIEDVPAFAHYPGSDGQVRYEEGLNIGYRGFYAAKTEPLFAFGHGLAYTQFDYSDVHAEMNDAEALVSVSLRVTNTGMVAGQEVVQAYCMFSREPSRSASTQFGRLYQGHDRARCRRASRFPCRLRGFSIGIRSRKAFQLEAGACTIQVGASARDLKLTTTLRLG